MALKKQAVPYLTDYINKISDGKFFFQQVKLKKDGKEYAFGEGSGVNASAKITQDIEVTDTKIIINTSEENHIGTFDGNFGEGVDGVPRLIFQSTIDSSKKDTDFKSKITLPDGLSMTEFIKKISHPLVEQTNQKNDHDSTNSTASITPPNSPFRNDEEEFKTDDA